MAAIGTRLLQVTLDSVEYSASLTNARLSSSDTSSDTTTFADAAAGGGKDWSLAFTAVQDVTTASLWTKIFSASGTTVPMVFKPYGNATPSATEPHFTGNATISAFDGDFLGGDANASTTAKFTFDAVWFLDGKPVKITA